MYIQWFSINEMNFVSKVGYRNQGLQLCLLRKSVAVGSLMPPENWYHNFPHWPLSSQSGKPMFSPLINIYFDLILFYVQIAHSSVNYTWFSFLSHEKFDDKPPCFYHVSLSWFILYQGDIFFSIIWSQIVSILYESFNCTQSPDL